MFYPYLTTNFESLIVNFLGHQLKLKLINVLLSFPVGENLLIPRITCETHLFHMLVCILLVVRTQGEMEWDIYEVL